MRCVSCDLPIFGHVIDIEQPATMDPRAFQLPNGRRRFVAWYQIVSGAGLMCLSVFAHAPWWQLLLMEGLAAMSLTAGVWLLHDDMRGYALTRRLQWVQLVQLQSSWLTYVAMSGVGIELNDVNGSIGISPGIMSKVILEIMPGQTFGVAVNLWAALLLLVLLQARPAQSASLTAPVHDESLAGAAQMTSGDAMKVPLAAEADAEPFRAAEAAIVNSMSRQGYVHIRTALLICRLRASDARRRLDIYRA
jgi:hypothetical protein